MIDPIVLAIIKSHSGGGGGGGDHIDGSKIENGTVTKNKLDKSVRNSLDLADSALQEDDIEPISNDFINSLFES